MNQKYFDLLEYLKQLKSVTVAFSGGVDSTFLLYAANEALGDKAIAVTADSAFFPQREHNEAKAYCEQLGVRQFIFDPDINNIEGLLNNPKDRCYLCKKQIFTKILEIAGKQKSDWVVEGSNLDDDKDYRPGMRAIKELGIKSPLKECGFTKAEIREVSQKLGLPTWDKPSFACLASRFVYGEPITDTKLGMVEKAEQFMIDSGFRQVRVRIHGDLARIEIVPDQFEYFMQEEIREEIYKKLKECGFSYIALDIKGYRTGSMNETL